MENVLIKYRKKYANLKIEIASIEDIVYKLTAYITQNNENEIKLNKRTLSLTKKQLELLDDYIIKVVEEKYPIQYIIGKVAIFNENYIVTPDVLIPRQDTEILIFESIQCIIENNLNTLLDLCTGSGVVGISIAKNSNISKCLLSDISTLALDIASKNINLNNAKKCSLVQSDLFDNICQKFDIIVSNPPYIKDGELYKLSKYLQKEPLIALLGGENGIKYYDIIYKQALKHLNNNGYILVEIGYDQADDVLNIISRYKQYFDVKIIKDLNGKDRVIKCRFRKK